MAATGLGPRSEDPSASRGRYPVLRQARWLLPPGGHCVPGSFLGLAPCSPDCPGPVGATPRHSPWHCLTPSHPCPHFE